MKAVFLGLLLASPPVAAWILRGDESSLEAQMVQQVSATVAASPEAVRLPVEVVTKGGAPQWIYVEVTNSAVPEPGVVSLLAVTSLLLLRRHRPSGK